MLQSKIILLMYIAQRGSEDIPRLDDVLTTLPFSSVNAQLSVGGDGDVLKFLLENYDGLFVY